MTLEKAIILQTIHNEHNPNYTDAERREAHNLSIEALKRLGELRCYPNHNPKWLLPGETEEIQ